tara:strand:+ start:10166 stop:10984 length:819 start_codon:yes stop_codon:yes gene_type:complete
MIMDTVKMNKISFIFALFLSACSISPGMQNIQTGFSSDEIYIESLGKPLKVINVNELEADEIVFRENLEDYIVAPGDILTFIVWGLDDVFPVNAAFQMNNPLNARTVENDGNIFFPYVGTVKVEGMTVKEIRSLITRELTGQFIEPQLDVTVTKFNTNRNIYLLGEVLNPTKIVLGIEPISLSDALGESRGMNPTSSDPSMVYVVRNTPTPKIFRIDLSDPSKLFVSSNFYLQPGDMVVVGTKGITRWNRVIAQLFPFTSFLRQIDELSSSN